MGCISILASPDPGMISTLNPGTFGTVTGVSTKPVSQRKSSVEKRNPFQYGDAPYSSARVSWSASKAVQQEVSWLALWTAKSAQQTLPTSPFPAYPGFVPRSTSRCCRCVGRSRRDCCFGCLWGCQSPCHCSPPWLSSSADNALWIPRISMADRTWYANVATSLMDMFRFG